MKHTPTAMPQPAPQAQTSPKGIPGRPRAFSARPREGFAVIIALSLMAFILLLLLSLVTFTRVEMVTTNAAMEQLKARQNALLGLKIAVGQLQRYAGADQAITAPASTVYPEKDELLYNSNSLYQTQANTAQSMTFLDNGRTWLTPDEREDFDQSVKDWWNTGRQPHWTGIFAGHLRRDSEIPEVRYEDDDDGTRYGEPRRMRNQVPGQPNFQLPVWLVSGNEEFSFDPATATEYPSGYLTPDSATALPDPAADNDTVFLVGAGSVPTNEAGDPAIDGLDGRVKARKVLYDQGPGDNSLNHYAYWVGDESTKYNFAVEDPFRGETDITSVEYRNRLQTPLYGGWRGLEPFSNPLTQSEIDNLLGDQGTFLRLNQLSETAFFNNALSGTAPDYKDAAARQLFHHGTVQATSLFTDPVLGGLKKDLTRYLERGEGLADTASILDDDRYENNDPRFSVYEPGANQGFPLSDNNLPVWRDLREWYNNDAGESPSAEIEPSANFAPVITAMRFHIAFSYDQATRSLRFHWYPVITLWNPYDVALRNASYELEFKYSFAVADMLVTSPFIPAAYTPTTDSEGNPVDNGEGFPFDSINLGSPGLPPPLPDSLGNAFVYRLDEHPGAPSQVIYKSGTKIIAQRDEVGPIVGLPYLYTFLPFGNQEPGDEVRFIFEFRQSFQPGETLVFSMPQNAEMPSSDIIRLDLVNDFDSFQPKGLFFDAYTVYNGPVNPPGTDEKTGRPLAEVPLRIIASPNATEERGPSFIEHAQDPSDIILRVGTDEASRTDRFGLGFQVSKVENTLSGVEFASFGSNSLGAEYKWRRGYGNGVNLMRRVNESGAFLVDTSSGGTFDPTGGDTRSNTSHLIAYGEFFLDPLIGSQPDRFNRTRFGRTFPFFARFNPRAANQRLHPIDYVAVDKKQRRGPFPSNNPDGFGRLANVNFIDPPDQPLYWDDTFYTLDSGKAKGYSLLTRKEEDIVPNVQGGLLADGLTELSIYNARRENSRVLSHGQFNSANLAKHRWQPGFAVGDGNATPYVDRAGVAGLTAYEVESGASYSSQTFPNNSDNDNLDLAYLLNENLWDRYFLSAVPPSGNFDPYDPAEFDNPRLRPIRKDGSVTDDDLRDFDTAAAHIGVAGGFNVNSTSVEAWRALLTSYRDLSISSASNEENPDDTLPVSRTYKPIEDPVDFVYDSSDRDERTYGVHGTSGEAAYSQVLGGFRYLSDEMIDALARRIVDEVRLRGPFFSLADFVNRRLVAPDGVLNGDWQTARTQAGSVGDLNNDNVETMPDSYDPVPGLTGIAGALQRAIDLSGINGGMNYPDPVENQDRIYRLWTNTSSGESSPPLNPTGADQAYFTMPWARYYLDMEHMAGAPASEAGHLFAHSPGFVTQANLLSMFGSALTARGDTFRIRAYGDSENPVTGITNKAYLEAIVQRMPDPVQAANPNAQADDEERWRPTNHFGRRFEVLSIRWISEDEI